MVTAGTYANGTSSSFVRPSFIDGAVAVVIEAITEFGGREAGFGRANSRRFGATANKFAGTLAKTDTNGTRVG